MNIGEAAAQAGVSAKMVRHYEHIGLLRPAVRTEAGYRQYTSADVQALRFVRQARGLGFSMEQIRELLSLRSNRGRSSRRVKALAQAHLDELQAKVQEMQAMQASLQRLISACAGDDGPTCGILDGLEESPPAPCSKQKPLCGS
jgi:Cu(I)-responsive transcriptional regulator